MPQLFALTANDRQELRQVVQTVNGTGRGVAPLSLRRRIIYSDAGASGASLGLGIVTIEAPAGQIPYDECTDLSLLVGSGLGGQAELCGLEHDDGSSVKVGIFPAQQVKLEVGKPVIVLLPPTFDPSDTSTFYYAVNSDIQDYLYAIDTYDSTSPQVLHHLPNGDIIWGATGCPEP